jgi:hypothetical protein
MVVVNKTERLNVRLTPGDMDKLRALAVATEEDERVVMRALLRIGTVKQVLRGVEQARKLGLRRAP